MKSIAFLLLTAGLILNPVHLWADAYYESRVLRIIVGYSPGGSYDGAARLIAAHLPKHLPGIKEVVVENKPGGGSLVTANYLAYKAKPDGLTIGSISPSMTLLQARKSPKIKFDFREMRWIGSSGKANHSCFLSRRVGVNDIQALRGVAEPVKLGSTRIGSGTYDAATLFKNLFNLPVKVIPGFKGTKGIHLAIEQGEVDGACHDWTTAKFVSPHLLESANESQLIPMVASNPSDDTTLDGVPLYRNLITDANYMQAYNTWESTHHYRRPLLAPPGTPEDRVAILRDAIEATLNDPGLLADAAKSGLEIIATHGDQLQEVFDNVLNIPESVLDTLDVLLPAK